MPRPSQSPAKRRPQAVESAPVESAPVDYLSQTDYSALFNEIDTDGSGEIDIDELFQCVSGLFPNAKISMRDVQNMLDEADTNGDGNISVDEFQAVLQSAEGKNTLWGKTQANIWNQFSKGLDETIAVAEAASAPLKNIARNNSYMNADGHLVASGGLRIFGALTGSFMMWLIMILVMFLFNLVIVPYILSKENLPKDFWTDKSVMNKHFDEYTKTFPFDLITYPNLKTVEDLNKLMNAGNWWWIISEIDTKGRTALIKWIIEIPFLKAFIRYISWTIFAQAAAPLLINFWCFQKSQNFGQWWFGLKMVNKDGNDLSFFEMCLDNATLVGSSLSLMAIIFMTNDVDFYFNIIFMWPLILSVAGFVDVLPVLCMGKSIIEMIMGYIAVIVPKKFHRE